MRKCEDELASYYAWLAESVQVADDYSSVTYKLRENAYWHDGRPVTIEDVLWTFDMIKSKGSPMWRILYEDIVRIEQIDDWSFRFHFSDTAEKTPQLVIETATFAPLPRHYWETRAFDETTLEPPLGNGPYRIGNVDPGYKVVFERVEDYRGKDLNFATGHFNFDAVEVIWFFDKYDFDATIRKVYTYKVPFPVRMRSTFTSPSAEKPNMTNYAGIRNPVVDSLVETISKARSEDVLNTAGRALDRVLLHNFYVIPDGHPIGRHMVYWDRFGHPPMGVPYMNWQGMPYLWWFDEEKNAWVDAGLAALRENQEFHAGD